MLVTVAAETERDYRNGPKGQSDPSIVLISYPQKGALISCDIEMESVKRETALILLWWKKHRGMYREKQKH